MVNYRNSFDASKDLTENFGRGAQGSGAAQYPLNLSQEVSYLKKVLGVLVFSNFKSWSSSGPYTIKFKSKIFYLYVIVVG